MRCRRTSRLQPAVTVGRWHLIQSRH